MLRINNRIYSFLYKTALSIGSIALTTVLLMQAREIAMPWVSIFGQIEILYLVLVSAYFLLASIYTFYNLRKRGKKGGNVFIHHLKGLLVVLSVLMLINFVSKNFIFQKMNINSIAETTSYYHFIMLLSVAVILDWLLFDLKGHFILSDPFAWLAFPLLYYGIWLLYYLLTSENIIGFNTPFSTLDAGSKALLIANVKSFFMVLLLFLVTGYILVLLDKLMGSGQTQPEKEKVNAEEKAELEEKAVTEENVRTESKDEDKKDEEEKESAKEN